MEAILHLGPPLARSRGADGVVLPGPSLARFSEDSSTRALGSLAGLYPSRLIPHLLRIRTPGPGPRA